MRQKTATQTQGVVSSAVVAAPSDIPAVAKRFPLPRYKAPERPQRITRRRLSSRRLVLKGAVVCMGMVLTVGGLVGWKAYTQMHKVFHGTSTVAALGARPAPPKLLSGEGDGRVNILLLGVGGAGHDGPDLTDTIVLFSIDPVNHKATMLSIPRDLWVKQPVHYFGSQQKINAAYESGKYHYLGKIDASNANAAAVQAGFDSLDQVVQTVTGVRINYHVLVNFQAFRKAVDTVGGVKVNVPTELYDPTMAWENHWDPVLAQPGMQQMNGVQALLYARSRETTSDFARGQRQRQILVALKDRALTLGTLSNPAKVDALMDAFGDNVYSDLSTQGAMRLYSIMKGVDDSKISSVGLTDPPHQLITTGRIGNASVDEPTAGMFDYTDIQSYIRSQLPDGYIVRENASVTVLAPTTTGARADQSLLQSYGYNVTAAATAPNVPAPMVIDMSHGTAPYTLHYLENRYRVKATKSLPGGVTLPVSRTKFVIIEPQ